MDRTPDQQTGPDSGAGGMTLDDVFGIIPDLFFLFDSDGIIIDYRAKNATDLYVPPTYFLGKKPAEVLPPAVGEQFTRNLESVLLRDGLRRFEYELSIKGSMRHFECRMSRRESQRQCIAIVRDITTEFLAQKALGSSEKRFQNLVEASPFPLIIVRSADEVILYANERAEFHFRIKLQDGMDLRAAPFYRFEEDRKGLLRQLEQSGTVFDEEIQLLDRDGIPFWAMISAASFAFDDGPAFLMAINDIDRHRKIELALETEKTLLGTLVRTIPDPVWVKDARGVFLACNPVFQRMHNRTEAQIVGHTDYDFLGRDISDQYRAADLQTMESGKPYVRVDQVDFADGSYSGFFETIKTPMYDESGNLAGVLGIARDITMNRKIQHELRDRVKEQQCLYRVFSLTENMTESLEAQLPRVANSILEGWQYPEVTAVRLECGELSYQTSLYRETPWSMESTDGQAPGKGVFIRVVYREERPRAFEGPFLQEERVLLDAICLRISGVIQRRMAAQTLRERESLVHAMFSQTTDAIVILDTTSMGIVDFNDAACNGLGYTRDEFSRLSVLDLQSDMDVLDWRKIIDSIKKGTNQAFETRHRHKNGSLRDVSITLRPVTLGGMSVISVVWRDITDQKTREQELKALAEHLKLHNNLLGQIGGLESAAGGDFNAFVCEVTALLAHALGVDRVSVWLFDESGRVLECCDLYELAQKRHTRGQVLRESEFAAEFAAMKSARYVDAGNALEDSRTAGYGESYLKPLGIRSMLDCGIISGGNERGVICFELIGRVHTWEADEIAFGCQIADQIGMALINQDRLKTSRALQRSEEFLKRAQSVSHTGHWYYDIKQKLMTWSDETYHIFGIEPGTPINLDVFFAHVHPEDHDTVVELWNTAIEGESFWQASHRIITSRELKWVEQKGQTEYDSAGKPESVMGTIQDVSVQVMTRKELDAYRLHLEELVDARTTELNTINQEQDAIFHAASMGICLMENGRILRCNLRLETIFGYGPGEMVGTSTKDLYPDEASYDPLAQELSEVLARDGYWNGELELRRRDGSRFWARLTAKPLASEQRGIRMVGMVEDITREREAAENLRRAKDAAEAANQSKSLFLANMSHEIRTPLNAVIGMSHLVLKTSLDGRQRDYLTKINNAGQHLLGVINEILDFSKIEAGKLTIEQVEFDRDQLLGNLASFLVEKTGHRGIELLFDIAPDVPRILLGDPLRIGQILLNFGGNAAKFTEKGEICIAVRVLEKAPDSVLLHFSVRDTGIGMSPEQSSGLFTSFQQADMSTTRKYGGTGLGLAISKRLAELMDGHVGFDTQAGKGSTFWLDLRLGVGIDRDVAAGLPVPLYSCPMLLVDDNDSVRQVMGDMLSGITGTVHVAASGTEALAMVVSAAEKGLPYRIAFIDWLMPGMDGVETARNIRKLEASMQPALVLMTAFDHAELAEKAQDVPDCRILSKPLAISTLHDTIMDIASGDTDGAIRARNRSVLPRHGGVDWIEYQNFSWARVLLVEDNEANQEVAAALLAEAGVNVVVAGNGRDGLQKLAAESFDLVFMDMQMPDMDGLQATALIRLEPRWNSLPIVAMTANAMQKDRDNCIKAGMNDFIAKPVDPGLLYALLRKWLVPPVLPAADGDLPLRRVQDMEILSMDDDDTIPMPLIKGLDTNNGLYRLLGKRPLYISLLKRFRNGQKTVPEQLYKAINAGDWNTAERLVHTCKGLSGSIGAADLQEKAGKLESAIRDTPDKTTVADLAESFCAALTTLVQELEIKLPRTELASAGMVDRRFHEKTLPHLRSLLVDNDAQAVDFFEEHAALFRELLSEEFDSLEKTLKAYDFEGTLARLSHISNPSDDLPGTRKGEDSHD